MHFRRQRRNERNRETIDKKKIRGHRDENKTQGQRRGRTITRRNVETRTKPGDREGRRIKLMSIGTGIKYGDREKDVEYNEGTS